MEIPKEEGYYVIQYGGGKNTIKVICYLTLLKDGTAVVNAINHRVFVSGSSYGGPGLRYQDKDGKFKKLKNVKFGPKIDINKLMQSINE